MAIVSYKHQFIFIKTRKTAGTSLEVHLSQFCGEDDIITPIYPPAANHSPRNFSNAGQEYFNHMSAQAIKDLAPRHYQNFFTFCFERHPVDKCISYFSMLKNSPHHYNPNNPRNWNEYVERNEFPIDTPSYVDQGNNLIVDKIYRYEEISASLEDITSRLQLPSASFLAREKSGFRVGTPAFEDVMRNTSQRNRIFDAFASSLRFTPYD